MPRGFPTEIGTGAYSGATVADFNRVPVWLSPCVFLAEDRSGGTCNQDIGFPKNSSETTNILCGVKKNFLDFGILLFLDAIIFSKIASV